MTDETPTTERPLLDLLRYKWTLPILEVLSAGECRFSELRRSVGDAPSNVLSERLKQLQRVGVVSRTVEATSPPQVTYGLTTRGEEFLKVVDQIDRL